MCDGVWYCISGACGRAAPFASGDIDDAHHGETGNEEIGTTPESAAQGKKHPPPHRFFITPPLPYLFGMRNNIFTCNKTGRIKLHKDIIMAADFFCVFE